MKIEALERLIINALRTQLASAKTAVSQTAEWIYVDHPRVDAKMPRISLTLTSSVHSPAGIGAEIGSGGTLGVWENTTFEVEIWVHRKNKTTGLSPQRGGTGLRDWLGDQVVGVFLAQRSVWAAAYNIVDVEKIGEVPIPYDEDTELFRKIITIRITHLREY